MCTALSSAVRLSPLSPPHTHTTTTHHRPADPPTPPLLRQQPDDDEEEREPPSDYNCYGVAESRIKKKRYAELYTIISNAMDKPLDNIEGPREVKIRMRNSGVWITGVELTFEELLYCLWGGFSVAFAAFSVAMFCYLDRGMDVYLSIFFVVNVGLGIGYTKYDIHGWSSKLYCCFFVCVMTSFFSGFLILIISSISEKNADAQNKFSRHVNEIKFDPTRITVTATYIFWVR